MKVSALQSSSLFKLMINVMGGALTRGSGIVFILLCSHQISQTDNFQDIWYYWSICILLHGAICIQYSHYSSLTVGRPSRLYIAIFVIIFFFGIYNYNEKYGLSFVWLSISAMASVFDADLIRNNRTLLYTSLNGIKNLFGILSFLFIDEFTEVLIFIIFGEIIRLVFVYYLKVKSHRMRGQRENQTQSFNISGYVRFISVHFLVFLLFFVDKTLILRLAPDRQLEYDLMYRMLDVPLTAILAGVIPIFFARYSSDKLPFRSRTINNIATIMTVALALAIWFFWENITTLVNLPSTRENRIAAVLFVSALPAMFRLTFERREFAIEYEATWPYLYFGLLIGRSALAATYLFARPEIDLLIYLGGVNLLTTWTEVACLSVWRRRVLYPTSTKLNS